jgi:large subunit ribosomal protein L14
MKAISANIPRTLTLGTHLVCSDNSGAKILNIIGTIGIRGTRRRNPVAGIGNVVIASVVKGKPEMVHKKVKALVVRQKKEIRRPNGTRVSFSDNAAVIVTDDFLPVATDIKGVVAREITERFPKVSAIASGVV